jgi:hypothetical protein
LQTKRLSQGWTEELLKNAITAKCVVRAFRDPDQIPFNIFFTSKDPIKATDFDLIMKVINKNGRFDEYLKYLKYEISYYKFENQETVDFYVDIGAVIFLEYVIRDNDGDPYTCEPTQFYFILDPAIDSVKTASRRLSKSFSDKVPSARDIITHPGFGIQTTEQSMAVARLWLDDVYMWLYNSKLCQEWSGGMPPLRDSDKYIQLRNRAFIMVHTASSLDLISGIGVDKKVDDEKSLYTTDTARGRIVARGQKKKPGKKMVTFRTSGTPYGAGTQFHKDQVNDDKWQYFAPMLCPMGHEKPVCYDCEHFTQTKFRKGELPSMLSLECTAPLPMKTLNSGEVVPDLAKCYKRIPDDRITNKELLEDWRDLGKTLWMQEYMCATIEYTGTAFNLKLIHAVVDEDLQQVHKSDLTCYVGVDFGKSEEHRSAIVVIGVDEKTGVLYVLNVIILPAGTPYRTRVADNPDEDHRKGVVEEVIDLFQSYPNIRKIVADATGVGKEYVENDMVDLCMMKRGFSNVVPFKISGESKSKLWLGTVKPAMETGRVKTYMDRQLYLQMRAWRSEYDPSKGHTKPRLTPPKAGEVQSDDALIAWFLGLYGSLKDDSEKADEDVGIGGINPEDYDEMSAMERGFAGI